MQLMMQMQEQKKMKVKKGWMAVQVGLGQTNNEEYQDYAAFRRFVIPISYLYNPLFQGLLDEAREVYGYQTPGILTLPSTVDDFLQIQRQIERSSKQSGCGKRQQLHHLAACIPSPSSMLSNVSTS